MISDITHPFDIPLVEDEPVDMEQFIDAIRQIGDYWFVLTRLPEKE